jgi:hypothetical protein
MKDHRPADESLEKLTGGRERCIGACGRTGALRASSMVEIIGGEVPR